MGVMTVSNEELEGLIKELIAKMNEKYDWKLTNEELSNTPARIVGEFEEWYGIRNYKKMTQFDNFEKYDEMIILNNIEFYALCGHHFLPFYGTISIGYIPKDEVVGISKLARIAGKVAYKPTEQERLTQEIADELHSVLGKDVSIMVIVKAKHLCMLMRGVKQHNSEMVTSYVSGRFKEDFNTRQEFLELIK